MAGNSNGARAIWCLLGAWALASCGSDAPGGGGAAGAAGNPPGGAAGASGSAGSAGARAGSGGAHAGGAGDSGSGASGMAGEAGEANGGEAGIVEGGSSGASGVSGGGAGGTPGGGAGGGTSGGGAGGTAGGGTAGATSLLGPAPVGIVSFYEGATKVCPTGWTRLAAADGRLLLATTTGTAINQQLGAALGNHQERMHTHGFTAMLPLGSHGVSSAGGPNTSAAAAGFVNLAGTLAPAVANLPYSQLLVCELTSDLGQGDGFPAASVAHFDKASCPSGWEAYAAANNRIITAAPGASGVNAGTTAHHQHTLDISMSLGSVTVATAAGNAQFVASSGVVTVSVMSDPGDDGVDQPTLSLLACRKTAVAEAAAVVPSGALSFLDADTCPTQWARYTDHEGRFLLGANANIGDMFGNGPALGSGENRMHTHQYTNTVLLPPQGLVAANGSGTVAGAAGTHPFQVNVQAASVSPPRLELRQCRKQ